MTPLTCAFGLPWISQITHGCLWCEAEGERLRALFDAAVAAGTYDQQGYSAKERKAQARRRNESFNAALAVGVNGPCVVHAPREV